MLNVAIIRCNPILKSQFASLCLLQLFPSIVVGWLICFAHTACRFYLHQDINIQHKLSFCFCSLSLTKSLHFIIIFFYITSNYVPFLFSFFFLDTRGKAEGSQQKAGTGIFVYKANGYENNFFHSRKICKIDYFLQTPERKIKSNSKPGKSFKISKSNSAIISS